MLPRFFRLTCRGALFLFLLASSPAYAFDFERPTFPMNQCGGAMIVSTEELHVAPTGSDLEGTGTVEKPWQTLKHALEKASSGATGI